MKGRIALMNVNSLTPYLPYIALGAAALSLVCFIFAMVAISSNARLRRQLVKWKEISSVADLEMVFEETRVAVSELDRRVDESIQALGDVRHALSRKVSTPIMNRYNAFAEVGNDLSYSVALVDDQGDGVVITSIYGRDDSVTYGKPVQAGDSEYQLTAEEQHVIHRALGKQLEREKARV